LAACAALEEETRFSQEKVEPVEDVRCLCGKIVCQIQNEKVIIKCRHCKRYIIIDYQGNADKEIRPVISTMSASG